VKKQQVIVIFLLATIISMTVPMSRAAESLSKPTVTLPANWKLQSETPYPNEISEHDPQGAGLLEYLDENTYDTIIIYYEKAPNTTYSEPVLQAEAEAIFQRDHEDEAIIDSGSKTVAGVSAGFAKGYDSDYDTYTLELVFVKSNYFFNAYAYYDANAQSEDKVNSLINSISVGGTPLLEGSMLYIIIGVIAAVVVIVVVVVLVTRRKKKTPQQAIQHNPTVSSPPPPP
jgi:hypothetical protein